MSASQRQDLDWALEWKWLVQLTYGIESGDPRLAPVLAARDRCDTAFLCGDVAAFKAAAQHVEEAVKAR